MDDELEYGFYGAGTVVVVSGGAAASFGAAGIGTVGTIGTGGNQVIVLIGNATPWATPIGVGVIEGVSGVDGPGFGIGAASGCRSAIGGIVAPVSGARGLVPTGAKRLGQWGEDRLEVLLGGAGTKPAKAFMTSDGPRYIDRLLNGIAHESKAGIDVKLTNSVWRQILKDKELIEKAAIEGAHWHFWQGATKELLETLTANGIRFTVH
jgi:hypothetical protein